MLGELPAAGGPHKQLSILAAIDGSPPAAAGSSSRQPGRAFWAVVALCAAALVLTAAWRARAPQEVPDLPSAASPASPATAAVAPAPPQAVNAAQASAAASAAAPMVTQVAGIENLPEAAPAEAATAAAPKAAPQGADAPVAKPPAARKAPTRAERRAQAKAGSKTTTVARAPARITPSVTAALAPAAATALSSAAAAKHSGSASPDADVELLAALMQHMNRDASGKPVPTAQGETTIANLVGRCKSLSGAEAQNCQRRICENYWGRAEACPRALAPTAEHRAQNESAVRP